MTQPLRASYAFSCVAFAVSMLGCEEDTSQCGAAATQQLSIQMYQLEWPEGAYRLRAEYQWRGQSRVLQCTFELPSDETVLCSEASYPFGTVDASATVAIDLASAPESIDIVLDSPDGKTHARTIKPQYTTSEICGDVGHSGSAQVSLDE